MQPTYVLKPTCASRSWADFDEEIDQKWLDRMDANYKAHEQQANQIAQKFQQCIQVHMWEEQGLTVGNSDLD
ncbi:hypothetical protein BG015_011789 [Linnemannia schmuckeri]|uniref:Uncharacterized protein n=1 Tax=Linnemannia schmuckeri TaxID=64567 RepID=A0A9P5RU82_9FUNG|nr:hypothetical protein BG015_011789 [Linnemannia schmuckeri]